MRQPTRNLTIACGLISTAVMLSGCAGNGDPTEAVIVTTTTVASTPATTTPGSTGAGASVPEATVAETANSTGSNPVSTSAADSSTPAMSSAPTPTPTAPTDSIDLSAVTVDRREIGRFEAPIGLAVKPGDTALYIVQQGGTVVRFVPESGQSDTVLDISGDTQGDGERGLLGLAFHPNQPLAYIYYTDLDGATTIAEFAVGADGAFDPSSERMVWRLEQPYSNHNGGDVQFGPDAMLYAGIGDGGSGGDPERRADDPSTPFGSLIRLDPTGRDAGGYSIPPDNPFGNEVWSYGLRNPWKFNFDPATGDLWIADVGQNLFEEIDRVQPGADGTPAGRGANFGWSAFEATTRYNEDVADPGDTVMPVLYYEHTGGNCSISGGAMAGNWYIYGDFCTGNVWAFDPVGARNIELGTGFGNISAIRNGGDGTVYVLDRNGPIYALDFG